MTTNYEDYFGHYIKLVDSLLTNAAFEETLNDFLSLIATIDNEKGLYCYEEDKWSIKEVIAHVIDVERVFAYRAMSFARNDTNDLAGFDDHLYAKNSGANSRSMNDLSEEFKILRKASIVLYKSFDKDMLARIGTANKINIDVKALGYLIAGHSRHHGNILQERYLVD